MTNKEQCVDFLYWLRQLNIAPVPEHNVEPIVDNYFKLQALRQTDVMRGQRPEPLPPDELLKYARLVISMSTDYSLGKIDAEHYVNVLGLAVESMLGGNGA